LYIGINLGHDSSVSLHDNSGAIVFATGEERLNRIKNYWGFPDLSMKKIVADFGVNQVKSVHIGSHSDFRNSSSQVLTYLLTNNPENYFDFASGLIPVAWFHENSATDLLSKLSKSEQAGVAFKDEISKRLSNLGIQTEVTFENHHDSHAFSAAVGSNYTSSLCITLDGEGDYESGTVQLWANHKLHSLARFHRSLSLGNFYTEVTKRYGFKPIRHEGKITGLAAQGKVNQSINFLNAYLYESNGTLIKSLDGLKLNFPNIHQLVLNHDNPNSDQALIDIVANSQESFPDLAANAQRHLEENVLKIVSHWKKKTKMENLALAGGVFSNVRLNQRIIEELKFKNVYIYPNMGDGGLAPGAVWGAMSKKNESPVNTGNLYVGSGKDGIEILTSDQILHLVKALADGKIIGFFQGRSEWGPRALGNRSIIASPSVPGVSKILNNRLERSDFMPFAPIVAAELAHQVFNLSNMSHSDNYSSMTSTVHVRKQFKKILKEVTNVDGTARPQVVENDKINLTNLLRKHYELTGCPVLINTSFNTHEHPIVDSERDALDALAERRIDILVNDGEIQYC